MDSKNNVGGNKKKLQLSRETIKTLRVKSEVRTGLVLGVGASVSVFCNSVGCTNVFSSEPRGYCN
jgi:hypothetical protein